MIISRTPFRITLGGGGTDLPFFYEKYGGFVLSSTIQKYINIIISKRFENNFRISYSKTEICNNINKIKHPLVRESLKTLQIKDNLEVVSIADLPGQSGVGSSGSFTVGLLHALKTFSKHDFTRKGLAELACHIEMDILKEPSGKQDQYAAAFGGFLCININKNGIVKTEKLNISEEFQHDFENKISYFFTGITRNSKTVLHDQKITAQNSDSLDHFLKIKKIGLESKKSLENENADEFGDLLDEHWELKKKTSTKISNSKFDKFYNVAKSVGVSGGKVIGAGGGGFLMFYTKNEIIKKNLKRKMDSLGLKHVKFPFESQGSKIILNLEKN